MGARWIAAKRGTPIRPDKTMDFPRKLTPAEYSAGLKRIVEEWRREQEAKRCSR